MKHSSKFSLVLTKVIEPGGYGGSSVGCLPAGASVDPAHKQTIHFAQRSTESCQFSGLAETKVKRMCGRIVACSKIVDVKQYEKDWTGVHSSLVVSLQTIDLTCWVNKLQLGN